MNGDILTDLDMRALLAFHTARRLRADDRDARVPLQHPYGVIRTEGDRIVEIVEKPTRRTP